VVNSTPKPHFSPGKDPLPIVQEVGWAPGPVWTAANLAPPGFDPRTVQPVAQSLYRLSYLAHTKEIGLEINADKTKYMVMSRDQNAGRNRSVKIDNSSFEKVEEFKYLGKTLMIKILFRKKLRVD
jgi:hypothetical protein